jgi:choline-sulfatase
MLRKGPYKLVAYYQELPELYDLEKDPGEFNNLADHPDYKDILKKLQNRLNELWDVHVLRRKVVQSQYNRYIDPKGSKEYQQLLEMGKKIRAAQS